MEQTDIRSQRLLHALIDQVRNYDEGRYNDLCVFSEQTSLQSRDYLNWLISMLYQKNWDSDYSIQQRTDHFREGISELNKRVIYLERNRNPGSKDFSEDDENFDKNRIDRFLARIRPEVIQTEGQQRKDRLRIAVFTPLSPLKNGIGDYMTVILLALKRYADIEIYIDDGYEPDDPEILQSFAIYRHGKFHKQRDRYDLILYEIGNNPHHVYIVPYVLQYPGILELHDFRLDYLYRLLASEYQETARKESVCDRYPEGCGYNPMNMYLIKASRGVLVHSEYSWQEVFNENMSFDVRKIEHFSIVVSGEEDASDLVKKHELEDCFLFSCFGFVNYPKRVKEIIIAFSSIVQKYPKAKIKLLIVGEFTEDYITSVEHQIDKHHLEKHVITTGYVTLDDMHKYMSITDVCLNLRYPYGGESSGTLARIMGMGKACIVNRIGAFDEIPDLCCHKIPYESDGGKEIENIVNAMSILFENSAYRKWIAGNAQRYVIEHLNLSRTVQRYREVLDHFYCKPTYDRDRLMNKACSFLAYNYFDDPYNAAKYFSFRLQEYFYSREVEEQQTAKLMVE